MPERMPLADLPDGSTFRLTGRKLATNPDGSVATEFIRPNGAVVGTLDIAADGVFSGGLTIPLGNAQVEPLAVAMQLGDAMEHSDTGETIIVRAVGLGPDGRQFSPSANQRPSYDPERWVKVGHVNLP